MRSCKFGTMNKRCLIVYQVTILSSYFAGFFLSEAKLMITATPEVIEVGTTSKLEVSCSYEKDDNQTASQGYSLTSLVLNRKSDGHDGTGLAFVSMQYPSTATQLPGANLTSLSGHVSASGVPSFTASWDKPTDKQTGTYTCEAVLLDSGGHIHVKSKDFQVVKGNNQLSHQYTVTMGNLRSKLKAARDCCSSLTQSLQEIQKWKSEIALGIRYLLMTYFKDVLGLKTSQEYKGSIYVLSKTVQNNADKAQKFCQSLSGYLAEVDDAKEWTFIQNFVTKNSVTSPFLIGGQDDIHEGHWYWMNSKRSFTYTPWKTGEPNNLGTENCLESAKAYGFQWNDIACNSPHLALCEFNIVGVTTN